MIMKVGLGVVDVNTVALANYGTLVPPLAPAQKTSGNTGGYTGTELWGWSSPELPAQNQFLTGIQNSPSDARLAIAQESGLSLPRDWQSMSLDKFLEWAGGAGQTGSKQENPLVVQAHSYQNESSQQQGPLEGRRGENQVAVRSVAIDEPGDFRRQQVTDNQGHLQTIDADFDDSKAGKWFNVTTKWVDGRCEVSAVKDKGYPVEVW